MTKYIFSVMLGSILTLSGGTTVKDTTESKSQDSRYITHEDAVREFVASIDSADPKADAEKSMNPDRLGLMCFKEELHNCPGSVDGVTTEMIRSKNFHPVYIWGLTGPVVDKGDRDKFIQFMDTFNTTVLQLTFERELNNQKNGFNIDPDNLIEESSLYGTWVGAEHFLAEAKEGVGNVPYELFDDPEGYVELTIELGENYCTISKSNEPKKDCTYNHEEKHIAIPGGMYGANYESGYQITMFMGDSLIFHSVLKNWVKKEDYTYTYLETANAILRRQ